MKKDTFLDTLHTQQEKILQIIESDNTGSTYGTDLNGKDIHDIKILHESFTQSRGLFAQSNMMVLNRRMLEHSLEQISGIRGFMFENYGFANMPFPKAALELQHLKDEEPARRKFVLRKAGSIALGYTFVAAVVAWIATCVHLFALHAHDGPLFFLAVWATLSVISCSIRLLILRHTYSRHEAQIEELEGMVRGLNKYNLPFADGMFNEIIRMSVTIERVLHPRYEEEIEKLSRFERGILNSTMVYFISHRESSAVANLSTRKLTIPGPVCIGIRTSHCYVFFTDSPFFCDFDLSEREHDAIEDFFGHARARAFL